MQLLENNCTFSIAAPHSSSYSLSPDLRDLDDCSFNFFFFCYTQGALEQVTEYLAEVVARPHLRKPRKEIIRLTREAREKRYHLVRQVHIGLPDLTPPMLPPRRQTWMGGVLDDSPPSSSNHSFDHFLQRMWRGERDRRSPSPPPPPLINSTFGGSRERRTAPSRSGRSNRNRSHDDDGNLRHILEISRMEYEAEQRLNKGEEREREEGRERGVEREGVGREREKQ